MENPVEEFLEQHLSAHMQVHSEYQLMQVLVEQELLPKIALGDELRMFQKHFLIRNALYSIQARWHLEKHYILRISALDIECCYHFDDSRARKNSGDSTTANTNTTANANTRTTNNTRLLKRGESQALAGYYLNWQNFTQASETSVNELLNSFWQAYSKITVRDDEEHQQALVTLGLNADVSLVELKKRYRQLANQQHPDKGGSSEEFIITKAAYELLLPVLENEMPR
ncbi:MAG: DnaJ-domain-containing protein 1 [Flavobacteriales bacterium]|jgi:DnaJ-domain-containing protein 1